MSKHRKQFASLPWPVRHLVAFKVQSHATRLYMCMCCGLFASTQFHFECCCVRDEYIYIHIHIINLLEMQPKNMEPLWKVTGFFNRSSWKVSDVHIVRNTWVLSLCLCVSISVSVSVSLSLCVTWLLIRARASLKIAETEQVYQVKRMIRGIGDMLFSIILKLKMCEIQGFLW